MILLQETWLNFKKFDTEISISGYDLFRKDRVNGEHGGILAYCQHDLCVTYVENSTATLGFEVM